MNLKPLLLLAIVAAFFIRPQISKASGSEANITVRYWLNGDDLKKEHINWFKMPDIFVVAEIEGQGEFLLPSIERGYQGQEVLLDFKAGQIQKGQKILINFYADHSTSNDIWNTILQGKATGIRVQSKILSISGDFKLVDKDVTIRGPQYLTQATFTADSGSFQQTDTLQDSPTGVRHGQVFLTVTQ